jgi:hypothetical protein
LTIFRSNLTKQSNSRQEKRTTRTTKKNDLRHCFCFSFYYVQYIDSLTNFASSNNMLFLKAQTFKQLLSCIKMSVFNWVVVKILTIFTKEIMESKRQTLSLFEYKLVLKQHLNLECIQETIFEAFWRMKIQELAW